MAKKGFSMVGMLLSIGILGIIMYFITGQCTDKEQSSSIKEIKTLQQNTVNKKIFSDLSRATLQIKMDNGGTLAGVFEDNEDARKKYRKNLGELAMYNLSFNEFQPECHNLCGKITIKNNYTVLVFKDGLKPADSYK